MKETKFKMTDIGMIPQDWEIDAIGNMSKVSSGGTPSTTEPSYWSGDIPWMNSGELNLKYVSDVENRITEKGLRSSSTHWIPKECVLIGLAGQGKTRGTTAFNLIPLCTNQSIGAIYPCEVFDSRYVYYYMDSKYLDLRKLSDGGGGRGGLTKAMLEEYQIPLPPLREQSRIASALSSIDNLLSSLDKLIAKKQAIKQGAMQQLLTGKKRLKGFNEPWVEKKLGEVAEFKAGKSLSKEDFNNVGIYPCYGGNGLRAHLSVYSNDGEFSLVGRQGELCGNVCYVTGKFYATEHALVVTPICNINSKYLFYKLVLANLNQYSKGCAQPGLSVESINQVQIKTTPNVDEQRAIASVLTSMDNELAALTAKKQKYGQIKQGMMQQLLTGKVRLT